MPVVHDPVNDQRAQACQERSQVYVYFVLHSSKNRKSPFKRKDMRAFVSEDRAESMRIMRMIHGDLDEMNATLRLDMARMVKASSKCDCNGGVSQLKMIQDNPGSSLEA